MGDRHQSEQAERDLCAALWADQCPYPWEPAALSEVDWQQWEISAQWREDEAAWGDRAQAFQRTVQDLWRSPWDRTLAQLPAPWIAHLRAEVDRLRQEKLEPLKRLVQAVQPLLQEWTEGDLQILARPLAYTMRSGDADQTLTELQDRPWDGLSPLEQARLTLAIAHHLFQNP